jgi:hypothetical protein
VQHATPKRDWAHPGSDGGRNRGRRRRSGDASAATRNPARRAGVLAKVRHRELHDDLGEVLGGWKGAGSKQSSGSSLAAGVVASAKLRLGRGTSSPGSSSGVGGRMQRAQGETVMGKYGNSPCNRQWRRRCTHALARGEGRPD